MAAGVEHHAANALNRIHFPAALGEPFAGQSRALLFVLVALRVIHRVVEPDRHDLFVVERKLAPLVQHRRHMFECVVVPVRFLIAAREVEQQGSCHQGDGNRRLLRNRYGSGRGCAAPCVEMPLMLSRLRKTSLTEATSYLLLLAVAMPLKYIAGIAVGVQVIGMIHGVLFLILIWLLVRTGFETSWPKSRIWLLALASLVPLMPYFLDRRVRGWIAESETM